MQKWWEHMKDIMDTHPDHSPVTSRLKEVFYLS
jgi:L-rhamnose mutarotase